ncbi:hypothetical protein [Sphingobium sp.]|uniref:hypothetical protein n=1 Tax=Sphingobium sp. TaxID=1912891 RepID=UPI0028BD24DA|nr:hypothetical protein [Sphingobium sp.]
MYKVDMDMYALTQDNPDGPVVLVVDDTSLDYALRHQEAAPATLGNVIGFGMAFALLSGFIVYMATAI